MPGRQGGTRLQRTYLMRTRTLAHSLHAHRRGASLWSSTSKFRDVTALAVQLRRAGGSRKSRDRREPACIVLGGEFPRAQSR